MVSDCFHLKFGRIEGEKIMLMAKLPRSARLDTDDVTFMPLVIPEFKKVLRRVLTLLLHPTPTDSGFYLIVNVNVVVKKCSLN